MVRRGTAARRLRWCIVRYCISWRWKDLAEERPRAVWSRKKDLDVKGEPAAMRLRQRWSPSYFGETTPPHPPNHLERSSPTWHVQPDMIAPHSAVLTVPLELSTWNSPCYWYHYTPADCSYTGAFYQQQQHHPPQSSPHIVQHHTSTSLFPLSSSSSSRPYSQPRPTTDQSLGRSLIQPRAYLPLPAFLRKTHSHPQYRSTQ